MTQTPDSTALAREAKTFTTNAQRTPETTALLVRALTEYKDVLRNWLMDNAPPKDARVLLDARIMSDWTEKYEELQATNMTLKALGVEQ